MNGVLVLVGIVVGILIVMLKRCIDRINFQNDIIRQQNNMIIKLKVELNEQNQD